MLNCTELKILLCIDEFHQSNYYCLFLLSFYIEAVLGVGLKRKDIVIPKKDFGENKLFIKKEKIPLA